MIFHKITSRQITFANRDQITLYSDNTGQFQGKLGSFFLNMFNKHKIADSWTRFYIIKTSARQWSEKSNVNPIVNIITEIN